MTSLPEIKKKLKQIDYRDAISLFTQQAFSVQAYIVLFFANIFSLFICHWVTTDIVFFLNNVIQFHFSFKGQGSEELKKKEKEISHFKLIAIASWVVPFLFFFGSSNFWASFGRTVGHSSNAYGLGLRVWWILGSEIKKLFQPKKDD
ncbi:hypothetical protein M0813_03487 [Anaeramoeba flamelloides]|uniref:Uncharacterized protein n=1 Tax=Anaeramoeba flamelloides TaxID=1746091 RepID=A0ABQ8XXZ3_9EUKA|nr:hypothetical protein M0813_03487 [Anaeramoeba flamelloides]